MDTIIIDDPGYNPNKDFWDKVERLARESEIVWIESRLHEEKSTNKSEDKE